MEAINQALSTAAHYRRLTGLPLVTLSYAQSLDGSLAGKAGQPLGLSGPEALKMTHKLRAAHAAILVGSGTLLADDPRLTARDVAGTSPQPVILDSRLRTPHTARIFEHPKPVWIATTDAADPARVAALEKCGARLFFLPAEQAGGLDLPSLLRTLAGEGVDSLMVEGGAQVISSFLSQRLAQQVVITVAPVFVGGLQVRLPAPADLPFPRLIDPGMEKRGDDLLIWGRLA